jgi:hypothetical protein
MVGCYNMHLIKGVDMLTRKKIETAIKKESGFDVSIQIGDGYYYFTSEDEQTQKILDMAYTASVYTYKLNHLSLIQWIDSFKNIMDI